MNYFHINSFKHPLILNQTNQLYLCYLQQKENIHMYKLNSDQINMVNGGREKTSSFNMMRRVGGPGTTTPKYLSVPEFKNCLETINIGDATFLCMPNQMPATCPTESWKQLQQINNERPFIRCGK